MMVNNDFRKLKKCPTDDCLIRTTSSLGGHFGSIKDWDMLTKINFVKNKYLWIRKICNLT
jgi:hypothetical protein